MLIVKNNFYLIQTQNLILHGGKVANLSSLVSADFKELKVKAFVKKIILS